MELILDANFSDIELEEELELDGGGFKEVIYGVAGVAVGMAVGFAIGGPVGAMVGGKNGPAATAIIVTTVTALVDQGTQKILRELVESDN